MRRPTIAYAQKGLPVQCLSERDFLEAYVARFANKPAYIHMGVTLTYAEVDRLSSDFAAYLHEKLRLSQGARVALMRNRSQSLILGGAVY